MKNLFFLAASLLIVCFSCSYQQPLFHSNANAEDSHRTLRQYFQQKEPVLKSGDKITISIWGHDDLSIGSVNGNFSSNKETGKWLMIDHLGEVNLPKIGRVKLAGYNLKEVNYFLEQQYNAYLKDPIINVKVVNHYVTVLGEVNRPGKYELENDKVTLVQMLGEAEGFGNYSNYKRVKVIREVSGNPVELIVDMTDIVASTEYNVVLQAKDIVYVEPTKRKSDDATLGRVTPIASLITGVAVLISVILK